MDISTHVKALNETRSKVWEEGKALLDRASDEKREFTAEEKASWDAINTRIDDIDDQVRSFVARDEREREAAVQREVFERQYGSSNEANRRERSELDEFRAWAQGRERRSYNGDDKEFLGKNAFAIDLRVAHREAELIRQGASAEEIRTLLWDTGSSGSVVPTTLSRQLYAYMEASITALRMPTTKITTDSGETLQFPRVAAHGVGTQVIAQGTAIGGTDPTFGRMQLDAYKYGQLLQISNEVLQDSGIDILGFIGQNMGRAVGRVIDGDLIVGTGTNEPLGIMNAGTGTSGTITTGGSLITPTYETLINLIYSVNDEYRSSGSAAFLMLDSTAGTLRKLRDGAGGTIGAVLWEPSLTNGIKGGQPDSLLGFPVYTDANVAAQGSNAKIAAFGDFSAYYIRLVGSMVIERSDDYAFNTDLVTFRAKQRIDGDCIDNLAYNRLIQNV